MSGAITAGTLATVAGIGAAGSVGGALIGSHAAGQAASAQANAAEQSAQLQYQASQNALDFQKQQWNTAQQEMMPWLQTGQGALGNLGYLMGIGSPSGGGQAPQLMGGSQFGSPLQGVGAQMPSVPGSNLPGGTQAPPSSGGFNSGSTRGLPGGPVAGVNPAVSPVSSGAVPALGQGSQNFGAPQIGDQSRLQLGASPSFTGSASSGGFGSLLQGYGQQFTAPTAADMQANDPGYQARLNLGLTAMEKSAAARGGLLTGGTLQNENQAAQDYASNEYNNYYNQRFNTFSSNYNQFQQQQANQYNRLAALAGVGQTAAGQLGTLGSAVSGQVGSNLLGTASAMGQDYQNAAAATASGYVGGANAWGGALGGIGSNISNLLMMQQMYGGGGSPAPGSWSDLLQPGTPGVNP